MNRVGIIGAGAAGLTAAIAAARKGASVTLIEHTAKAGKKLLATGNGRCNLTNASLGAEHYPGNSQFVLQVFDGFGREDALRFFEDIGIMPWENPEGYIYPRSLQAASVAKALISEAERLKVKFLYEMKTASINLVKRKQNNGADQEFQVKTDKGTLIFDRLILACGSKAAPNTGSDGSGYALAEMFGLNLAPVVPALVPLTSDWKGFKEIAGVRVRGRISLYADGKQIASEEGELQMADYGLSGIPVFQVSRYAARILAASNKQKPALEASLDFFPELSMDELRSMLHRYSIELGHLRCVDVLCGLLPEKLAVQMLKQTKTSLQELMGNVDGQRIRLFARTMKELRVLVTGTLGFDRAQICAGGVKVSELDPDTMECKRIPGLFVVGELVDVDGLCGGYNLQFAWSSGYLAGDSAASR